MVDAMPGDLLLVPQVDLTTTSELIYESMNIVMESKPDSKKKILNEDYGHPSVDYREDWHSSDIVWYVFHRKIFFHLLFQFFTYPGECLRHSPGLAFFARSAKKSIQ